MAALIPHLRYLRKVLLHKWYVYREGRKLGLPRWRLIIHDYSKFSRAEWGPYVRRFESGNAGKEDKAQDPDEFRRAWEHHWHTNPHHWEFWSVPAQLNQDQDPMRMPDVYALEMVADWQAASRVYSGKSDCRDWYEQTKEQQKLHPQTRALVERIIYDLPRRQELI